MFDKQLISSKLYGLVGSRNPFNPAFAIIDAANQVSRSGLYTTDNSFCKIQSLKECQDYSGISDAEFNTMLKRMQESAINSVAQVVFNNSDFIDRNLMFSNASNLTNTEILPDGFVGYKIQVDSDNDIAFEIKRVLLSFSGSGNIDLILWNTGSKTALKTKTIAITTDNQEEVLDWKLDNSSTTYKGDYYIGYNTNGLTVTPYKRDYNCSSVMNDIDSLFIEKVYVSGHNTNTLFDLDIVDSTDVDLGLNLDISVFYDYTDLIINNEMLFARAINISFQIAFLSEYASSVRHNEGKRSSENIIRIIQELEGQNGDGIVKVTGLKPSLLKEISLIKNELDRLRTNYNPEVLHTITIN